MHFMCDDHNDSSVTSPSGESKVLTNQFSCLSSLKYEKVHLFNFLEVITIILVKSRVKHSTRGSAQVPVLGSYQGAGTLSEVTLQ